MSSQNTTLPSQSDELQKRLILSYIVIYVYYIIVLSLSCSSLLGFCCALQRVKFKLSGQLTIHIFLWFICGVSSLIYAVPSLLSLTTSYVEDNLLTSMIRGTLNISGIHSIQLSTLFLIINRIQAILFPSSAVTRYRYWCQYASLFTFFLNFTVIFVIVFRRGYSPKSTEVTACLAFGCKMSGQLDDITLYKMVCGVINIALGTFFVFIYFRYARLSAIRKENRKNFAVLLILVTELLFTVIPNALYLITNNALISVFQLRMFSILAIAYAADIAVTAIVYWTTWYRIIFPIKVQPAVTILNANPNQMATSGTTGD